MCRGFALRSSTVGLQRQDGAARRPRERTFAQVARMLPSVLDWIDPTSAFSPPVQPVKSCWQGPADDVSPCVRSADAPSPWGLG